jgi:carboxylate-amine ligase
VPIEPAEWLQRTPSPDLASRLRTAFDASVLSLTVGAEEELLLVDSRSGRLSPAIHDVLARMDGDSRVAAEFRASQVELVSRPYLSAADVGRDLAFARVELAEAAERSARPVASGTHPTAEDLGPVVDGERYAAIAADNPWAARDLLTCGLHVHVAVGNADRALAVYNALRSYLPELVALGANSPFHRSRGTGAACNRHQLNRCLARHGVPPAFSNWSSYVDFVAWGRSGGSIPDHSYHWWDLRLHPEYGTLEVRACDVQTDVADSQAIIGLTQTLVAWLVGHYDSGDELPAHDTYRISESVWMAARSGASGTLVDLDTGEREAARSRIGRLLEQLAPVAAELGTERELARASLLSRTCGAERQARVARERGLDGLVDWLAAETLGSARRLLARAGISA